jgi:glycogen synthase
MKALFLTNEYPPAIYGGAGVHVEYLSRELARLIDVEVRSFGGAELAVPGLISRRFDTDMSHYKAPKPLHSIFGALQRCIDFNTCGIDADVVHCHTWYAQFGGILAKLNFGKPLVITVHSLEPLRPWKREQLGGGYDFTVWLERTALEMADAVITVSEGTRVDVERLFNIAPERLRVIHNGIDPSEYKPVNDPARLRGLGIDPDRPYVLFVGRIARQKGIIHLVRAIPHLARDLQVVLCAGAPDTPEIAAEMRSAVEEVVAKRDGVIWIEKMVDVPTKVLLYSHAFAFCCPSIYEPFGIINLEAMACGTPVVAAKVGGIPEVVVDGVTGILVELDQLDASPFEPVDPAKYSRDLAGAINALAGDPALRERMSRAGRERVVGQFSWESIAKQTVALYEELIH